MADRTSTVRVNVVTDTSGGSLAFGKLGKAAGAAALGVGALAVGVGVAGSKAVAAASEVQQSFGALDSVFKSNADEVKRWADQAAESVGLSKAEYAGLAAVVGAQLKGMGLSLDEATVQSDRLITIGADLAATFGGNVSDAVAAVGSLLRGEMDPIEQYGVSIKQADVNARLAAQGLDGLTGEALKQAQAQTVLAMLTEKTKDAQGAFARESNTLAGQQARLSAEFDNAKAALGERFLPIVTAAIQRFREEWAPQIRRVAIEVGENLRPKLIQMGEVIREDVVPALRRFGEWVQDHVVPAIVNYGTPALEGAKSAFNDVRDAIKRNEPELREIGRLLVRVAEFILDDVAPVMGKFAGTNLKILGTALGTAIDVLSNFYNAWKNLLGIIQSVIDKIQAAITKLHELRNAQNAGTGVKGGGGSASTTSSGTGSLPPPGGTHRVTINMGVVTDPRGAARELERMLRRAGIAGGVAVGG